MWKTCIVRIKGYSQWIDDDILTHCISFRKWIGIYTNKIHYPYSITIHVDYRNMREYYKRNLLLHLKIYTFITLLKVKQRAKWKKNEEESFGEIKCSSYTGMYQHIYILVNMAKIYRWYEKEQLVCELNIKLIFLWT